MIKNDSSPEKIRGQIRQNKITKQWVIYAPRRDERPRDFGEKNKNPDLPQHDPDCPFCPGNEAMLPGIIWQYPEPDQGIWSTRVVPNKFPALTSQTEPHRQEDGIYFFMPGYGHHEVMIETPRHDHNIAQMSLSEVEDVIHTYHQRYRAVMEKHAHMLAILFRNHGARAGTSLMHPHSQMVVTGVVPAHIRWWEFESRRYFDKWSRCVLCDILSFEAQDQVRLVSENGSFQSFIPYAAEVPFEIWIVPQTHQADFGAITSQQKTDLAAMLRDILKNLSDRLDDPDYNYVIHSAAQYQAGKPFLHWYLQIQPRLTTPAGFEMGSGMRINPSLPEEDAQFLRTGLANGPE
jgi:UDPglucose--hexose-1-phosphate uridylyltransferase